MDPQSIVTCVFYDATTGSDEWTPITAANNFEMPPPCVDAEGGGGPTAYCIIV